MPHVLIVIPAEVAEPGFCTVRVSEPVDVASAAEIARVSCDEFTKVVVRGEPFHNATAPGRKPLPDKVNLVFPLFTVIEVLLALVSTGAVFAFNWDARTNGPRISRICDVVVFPRLASSRSASSPYPQRSMRICTSCSSEGEVLRLARRRRQCPELLMRAWSSVPQVSGSNTTARITRSVVSISVDNSSTTSAWPYRDSSVSFLGWLRDLASWSPFLSRPVACSPGHTYPEQGYLR